MCGSNSQQTAAQAQEAAFSKQMMQENATVFGQQQNILSSLNAGFQKIIANGPSQEGFAPSELTNLQSTGTEDTARGETNAMRALGQGQAAEGGGNTFIPSGVKQEQQQEVASAGADSNTQTQEGIINADYAQGNVNYDNAVAGSQAVAADLNPIGYSEATTNSNQASASEANAIAQSANSPFTAVMGALGGLAGAAATAYGAHK